MNEQPHRWVVDSDSHVTEPENIFVDRVSSKWGDLVPHVKFDPDAQEDGWYIGDHKTAPAWGSAAAGHEDHWPPYPRQKEEAVVASYDAAARLRILNAQGIAAQVLYPNIAGFGGEKFLELKEPALMLECARAYNDFLTDWMSIAPERFIGVAALPFWDVKLAVEELHRAVGNGHRGILFSGAPHELGMPYLSDRHWDPIWAAAQEAGVPVSFHLGSGDVRRTMNPDRTKHEGRAAYISRVPTTLFLDIASQMNDLLFSGVLPRFPELHFIMVESGIGAIPFVVQSADYHFSRSQLRQEKPEFSELPSFYFHRQVATTFWFEDPVEHLMEAITPNNALFETDFPHPTSLREDTVLARVKRVEEVAGEEVAEKLLYSNAADLYHLPPPPALTAVA